MGGGENTEWVSDYCTNALWWDKVGMGRSLNGYRVTVPTLYGGIEWVGGEH